MPRIPLIFITLLLFGIAGTNTSAQATVKTLEFSGYTWELRRSSGLEGPGPNRFLDNRRTIWLDDEGGLHLRVWQRLGSWFAAEVVLTEQLGYGTYLFETVGAIDSMDPPVILGMFTYDDDPAHDHREIDIEYGQFGSRWAPNAQFVLQPFDLPGNRHRFTANLDGEYVTHAFTWAPEVIEFASFHGHLSDEVAATLMRGTTRLTDIVGDRQLASWAFDGTVPPPGDEKVHINLWLYQTEEPSREHEVVIRSFRFVPGL